MKHTRKRRSNISREFRLPANVMHEEAWEDSGPNMKLSRAFIVVLVLHIVAVGGLAAFNLFDRKQPKIGSDTKMPDKPAVAVAKQDDVAVVQPKVVNTPTQSTSSQLQNLRAVRVDKEMSTSYFALQYGLSEDEFLEANKYTPLAAGTLLRGETVYIPSDAVKRSTVDDLPTAPVVNTPAEPAPEVAVVAQPAPPTSTPKKTYIPPKRETKKPTVTPKPKPKPPVASSSSYKVRKGDTLYSIARRYRGVSHTDIMRANGISARAIIKPGQVLKIPKK